MRIVGSAVFPKWQQILLDTFELEIVSSDLSAFAGCVGSAVISGIALGRYRDYTEVHRFQRAQRITFPIDEHVRFYREFFPVFEDCYYALSEINRCLPFWVHGLTILSGISHNQDFFLWMIKRDNHKNFLFNLTMHVQNKGLHTQKL